MHISRVDTNFIQLERLCVANGYKAHLLQKKVKV